MQHPLWKKHASQGLRFAVCGAIGAIIDLSSLRMFVGGFGLDPKLAFLLSSLLSVTFVFFANKFFTFKNRSKSVGSQATKFAVVYGPAIFFNVAIASYLESVGLQYLLAKMVAIGIVMVWNYALSHGFVFRGTPQGNLL